MYTHYRISSSKLYNTNSLIELEMWLEMERKIDTWGKWKNEKWVASGGVWTYDTLTDVSVTTNFWSVEFSQLRFLFTTL